MDLGRIIDISMELNEKTVVWKEDDPPKLEPVARIPDAPVNFTWLHFGSHAGTHIDAPFYLYKDGWTTDQIPLERLMGRCQVLDLTGIEDTITAADLKDHEINREKVLLKTKNSYDLLIAYNPRHVVMDESAARYLVEQGVTTLGYDYQSFEREGRNDIHRIFLSKGITIIDNLRLKDAEQKEYHLICLPLKVTGIDGAPARAILIDEEEHG
jgi:arylformamidase